MRQQRSFPISIIVVILILAAAVCGLYFLGTNRSDENPEASSKNASEALITEQPASVQAVAAEATALPTVTSTPGPAVTLTSEPTITPMSKPTATPTSKPTSTPTTDPTKKLSPEPIEYLGDPEEIPAGTLVEEDHIDRSDLDLYFQSYEISDTVFERIYGDNRSYKTYCTVPREDLRYIKVLYRGFDGSTYIGELIVNALLSEDILSIFKELYLNDYPIELMVLVDEFDADDDVSIAHNNTSAFNFRPVTGGTSPSNHAYGVAIDINPKNNPYIEYDASGNMLWYDEDVELYLDREAPDAYERHMINYDDLCYKLFAEHGWDWGGDWTNPVDYQHFEKPVYP